jgi:hypothetical protein
LFRESFVCELIRQFSLKLRRHNPQQVGVICDEGEFHIRLVEYQRVPPGIELYRNSESALRTFSGVLVVVEIPLAWD